MSEPSEAAKAKALGLFDAADLGTPFYMTFARFIQQVSDAVKGEWGREHAPDNFAPFILPEPVDPLEQATKGMTGPWTARAVRVRFAEHGFKVVEASDA